MAMNHLRKNDIPFTEVNTSHDTFAREYIEEQGIELQIQRENEHQLGILFQGLKKNKAVKTEIFEDTMGFGTLKGKLTWPVRGALLKKYGANKKVYMKSY